MKGQEKQLKAGHPITETHIGKKSPGKYSKRLNSPFHVIKIRRNSPCPCGSGKKYKRCCI